jgi:uncharacterized protein with von Willebrand factor type A (vWA) domain
LVSLGEPISSTIQIDVDLYTVTFVRSYWHDSMTINNDWCLNQAIQKCASKGSVKVFARVKKADAHEFPTSESAIKSYVKSAATEMAKKMVAKAAAKSTANESAKNMFVKAAAKSAANESAKKMFVKAAAKSAANESATEMAKEMVVKAATKSAAKSLQTVHSPTSTVTLTAHEMVTYIVKLALVGSRGKEGEKFRTNLKVLKLVCFRPRETPGVPCGVSESPFMHRVANQMNSQLFLFGLVSR